MRTDVHITDGDGAEVVVRDVSRVGFTAALGGMLTIAVDALNASRAVAEVVRVAAAVGVTPVWHPYGTACGHYAATWRTTAGQYLGVSAHVAGHRALDLVATAQGLPFGPPLTPEQLAAPPPTAEELAAQREEWLREEEAAVKAEAAQALAAAGGAA